MSNIPAPHTIPNRRFPKGLRRAMFAVLIIGVLFAVSTAVTMAQAQKGKIEEVNNPIASLLLRRFAPNPNLLVEDHVRISCESEFSVKVFTVTTLHNAKFTVTDADGNILGGASVDVINPLWQKVWLKNLPLPLPEKIWVTMTAATDNGKVVTHTLIVEPDCKRKITARPVVIWPIGKTLINPLPPQNPDDPNEPPRFKIPDPLVMFPPEAVGLGADTIVRRDSPTGETVCGPIHELVPIELVQLSLVSCEPITVQPVDSFFDVFYEVRIGDLPPLQHAVRLIDATPLEHSTEHGGNTLEGTPVSH